ncbi:DNA helicase rad5 [Rhizophlyctis rosea]|uniref:DNA helicase rad5 n=1 Tax=Rhizophlyctis rosea TaxID=64517 RepID=A0AAD5SAB5_9FUNG|nr:DNA helicase rad5 [Rhizophlyctis rosea]
MDKYLNFSGDEQLPTTKRARLCSPSPADSDTTFAPPSTDPTSLKRAALRPSRFPVLLGEMVVVAYSTVRGTNIIREGDQIRVERVTQVITAKKRKRGGGFAGGGGSSFSAGAKGNTIVRVFKGSQDDIILSISVSLTQSAFMKSSIPTYIKSKSKSLEADDRVKETKSSLTLLFDRLSIRPVSSSPTTVDINLDLDLDTSQEEGCGGEERKSEVTAMDLGLIYRKAEKMDKAIGRVEPRGGMKLTLRDYQSLGLGFLMMKESGGGVEGGGSMSPLWHEYRFAGGEIFYFNPYSGELSLDFPKEEHCCGGILADEMGLGKTIQILSLIHTNRRKQNSLSASQLLLSPSDPNADPPPTHSILIVCPLNVIGQWRNEIERCFDPGLVSVEFYYGNERTKGDRNLFRRRDAATVVLTTYGTLASEYGDGSSGKESPLFGVTWFRVVLDEAHYIKERSTRTSKACCALLAEKRWAVTGTPIVNSLEDLYSLIHFLRVEPWSHWSFWQAFISVPFSNKEAKALEIVQTILEPVILRRTKDMKDEEGNPIVVLPTKKVEIKYLEFSEEEQGIYDNLNWHSKRRLSDLKSIGKADYAHVFQLILRLRQACDHPLLVKLHTEETKSTFIGLSDLVASYCGGADAQSSEFAKSLLTDLEGNGEDEGEGEGKECPVCLEVMVEPVVLPCLHTCCEGCMSDYGERRRRGGGGLECPVCREPCEESQLLRVVKHKKTGGEGGEGSQGGKAEVSLRGINFKASTKLRALVEGLKKTRDEFPGVKTVVFSQWTSMLNFVEVVLKEHGFNFVRLDGTLSQKTRESVLDQFATDDDTVVLIASLRSTGVGVNLTMASRVVMLDPWWNESVEKQAVDRVHRLGQTLPVEVLRFIMAGTVEEKMLAIQQRKSELAGAVTSPEESKLRLEDLMALFD